MSPPGRRSRSQSPGQTLPRPLLMMVSDRRLYTALPPPPAALVPLTNEETAVASLVAAAAAAARAGVNLVQVRERGLEDGSLLSLAVQLREAIAADGARLVVNDRLDVALAAGAAGVHLPGRAVAAARVRAVVPDGFLIGRSVHSEADAVASAREGGCDYLIFGSVFESTSKPAGHAIAGLDALARVCAAVRLPVVAIGGITAARVPDIVRAGAAGVAAIGLFGRAEPRELVEIVGQVRQAFGATPHTSHTTGLGQ
jgi:thiamine-phosphate pyrophosphorylase